MNASLPTGDAESDHYSASFTKSQSIQWDPSCSSVRVLHHSSLVLLLDASPTHMSAVLLERLLSQRSGVLLPRIVVPTAGQAHRWSTAASYFQDDADEASARANKRSRTLREYADGPIERPPANEPITSSPRTTRGVHRRDLRQKGQTPAEKAQIDQALREIFQKLDDKGPSGGRFDLGPSNIFDMTLREGTGPKPWSQSVRQGFDREENDDVIEALDGLKEEVSAIQTDHELLDWARRRVFDPLPRPTSDAPSAFPKTYPRILAHLMKVARQSFNNPHLSLSFFHHAQTLSPESYLSGCLSSAYTELIRTRWECFRDLDGVHRAIKEMDENAVSWDKTTQREIGKIVEQVSKDVLQRGPDQWGPGVYEILDTLEKKVSRAIGRSEYMEQRSKRHRERRLWM